MLKYKQDSIKLVNDKLIVTIEDAQLEAIEEIIEKETGLTILRKEWQSKYNSYVVYDYRPFCSCGFEVIYEIAGDSNKLNFLAYLLDKKLRNLQHLENCLTCV